MIFDWDQLGLGSPLYSGSLICFPAQNRVGAYWTTLLVSESYVTAKSLQGFYKESQTEICTHQPKHFLPLSWKNLEWFKSTNPRWPHPKTSDPEILYQGTAGNTGQYIRNQLRFLHFPRFLIEHPHSSQIALMAQSSPIITTSSSR